jgi:hypothetical protein
VTSAREASPTTDHARCLAKPCCFMLPDRPSRMNRSPASGPGDGKRTGLPPRTFFVSSTSDATSRNITGAPPTSNLVTIPPRDGATTTRASPGVLSSTTVSSGVNGPSDAPELIGQLYTWPQRLRCAFRHGTCSQAETEPEVEP